MKPKIKGRLGTDEKQMKLGSEYYYDINTIDGKTKFVIEEEFMKSRTKKQIFGYFRRIKSTIYRQALEQYHKERQKPVKKRRLITFVSDGFENYGKGASKYFYGVCKIVSGVPIACKKYGLKHNNNHIERYNQDIDDRYKTTRNGHSFESTRETMKMRQAIHNFVNPNMELKGRTPAEAAGIKLDLGRNKLLKLIEISCMPKS